MLRHEMFKLKQLNILDNVKNNLADPQFNKSGSVDILFGTELFYDIFSGTRQQLFKYISLHITKLGWIHAGN